ncbi:DedA family protein [Amycolatopsis sp. NPDC051903]|uniref:DedA family protein n=1 Tax=Amycolatopsis sp. NPDC051903 TaxID=3363936 RepID=UPI0037A66421
MNVASIEAAGVGVSWLDTAGPLLVWVIVLSFVFVECALIVGLFLPGDSLLFGAGVVLAQHGSDANAWLLSGAALVVAVGGNQVGYYIGRSTGTRLIARRGGKVLNRHNLDRAQRFLDRKGFFAIVAARWIPWIRTLAPLIAGAARMDSRRFLVATSLGGLLWVPTLVLLGYYGAGLLDVLPWLKTAALWVSVAFFVFGTGYGVLRYRQEMRRPVDEREDATAATVTEQG